MSRFMMTSTSGWFVTLLIVATIIAIYTLRRRAGRVRVRYASHIWFGIVIVVGSFLHLWASATASLMRSADPLGLQIATAGLVIIVIQAAFGARLTARSDTGRAAVRSAHFIGMAIVLLLIGIHVALNSPLSLRF